MVIKITEFERSEELNRYTKSQLTLRHTQTTEDKAYRFNIFTIIHF
jgi:hypothetical protein